MIPKLKLGLMAAACAVAMTGFQAATAQAAPVKPAVSADMKMRLKSPIFC